MRNKQLKLKLWKVEKNYIKLSESDSYSGWIATSDKSIGVATLNERGFLEKRFFEKTYFLGNSQNFGDSGSTVIFRQNLPTNFTRPCKLSSSIATMLPYLHSRAQLVFWQLIFEQKLFLYIKNDIFRQNLPRKLPRLPHFLHASLGALHLKTCLTAVRIEKKNFRISLLNHPHSLKHPSLLNHSLRPRLPCQATVTVSKP